MPRLIVLTGAPAVGKMAVGKELHRLTNITFTYNHETMEPVYSLFGRGRPEYNGLIMEIRERLFGAYIKDVHSDLIFTLAMSNNDRKVYRAITKLFTDAGYTVSIVYLYANANVREYRNATPERLNCKRSKSYADGTARPVSKNKGYLETVEDVAVLYEYEPKESIVSLDTSSLSATDAAKAIMRLLDFHQAD